MASISVSRRIFGALLAGCNLYHRPARFDVGRCCAYTLLHDTIKKGPASVMKACMVRGIRR